MAELDPASPIWDDPWREDLWHAAKDSPAPNDMLYVLDPTSGTIRRKIVVEDHHMTLEIVDGYIWLYRSWQASDGNKLLKIVP